MVKKLEGEYIGSSIDSHYKNRYLLLPCFQEKIKKVVDHTENLSIVEIYLVGFLFVCLFVFWARIVSLVCVFKHGQ